jgi:hypothetical protein
MRDESCTCLMLQLTFESGTDKTHATKRKTSYFDNAARSSCAHLHEQPETAHSSCCSNHSRMCEACPPWRQCWHHTIQWPKADEMAPHALSGAPAGASTSGEGRPSGSGSGQPRCCWQTAHRGSGLRQRGFGQRVALGAPRADVDCRLVSAMGEVQSGHVHACCNQAA